MSHYSKKSYPSHKISHFFAFFWLVFLMVLKHPLKDSQGSKFCLSGWMKDGIYIWKCTCCPICARKAYKEVIDIILFSSDLYWNWNSSMLMNTNLTRIGTELEWSLWCTWFLEYKLPKGISKSMSNIKQIHSARSPDMLKFAL